MVPYGKESKASSLTYKYLGLVLSANGKTVDMKKDLLKRGMKAMSKLTPLFKNASPKCITYIVYESFMNDKFVQDLKHDLFSDDRTQYVTVQSEPHSVSNIGTLNTYIVNIVIDIVLVSNYHICGFAYTKTGGKYIGRRRLGDK